MGATIIVIEGTDGSGKKTQTQLLLNKLKEDGFHAVSHSFPTYESQSSGPVKLYLSGELGENASNVTPKQASVLFAADRVATFLNVNSGIKKLLNENEVIILDRYVYSNMIHQACKLPSKDIDNFLSWLCELEFESLSLPKANLIFFLDMPPKTSKTLANARQNLKAGTKQDIHENDSIHLNCAYKTAKYVANKYGWTQIRCVDSLDNLKSIDQISQEIYNITKNFLSNKN